MKAKEIRDLINFIASSGLDEVNLETEEIKLHIKKQSTPQVTYVEQPAVQSHVAPVQHVASTPPVVQATETTANTEASKPAAEDSNYVTIKSPMIGTFYRAANPESDAFASVGDTISEGKVVCIIEAMKLFNEIESEISGKIVKVLVDNASPVEYDQPLFLVDPS